jgi:hypothetical protein
MQVRAKTNVGSELRNFRASTLHGQREAVIIETIAMDKRNRCVREYVNRHWVQL